ncbi:hypothetical protein RDI58_022553 [Solanum bulbocastanum]|uniref:Uncharacterized protein n=1 Tax=Solanum bulbocastanum TaxID=147425 RepID=A0AAN8Y5R6_SOLBU
MDFVRWSEMSYRWLSCHSSSTTKQRHSKIPVRDIGTTQETVYMLNTDARVDNNMNFVGTGVPLPEAEYSKGDPYLLRTEQTS